MAQGSCQYATSITATSSGGAIAFVVAGATGVALEATTIHVVNSGSSSAVYFNFTTTSGASTGDFPLRAGKELDITARKGYFTGLSYVAAVTTSSSVVCDILAFR